MMKNERTNGSYTDAIAAGMKRTEYIFSITRVLLSQMTRRMFYWAARKIQYLLI